MARIFIFLLPFLSADVCLAKSFPMPLVIAHRGASGLLPEHTLEAYALAIEQGAHFIEPDLVITRDGILIARHENELSDTTDVAEKFASRVTTRMVDGKEVTGWFTEDFTAKEIATLRAKERLPFRNQASNGKFRIPTLDDILVLVQRESVRSGRPIGVYLETKHSTYFRDVGLALEPPVIRALTNAGLTQSTDWVFIQSFEIDNLRSLDTMTDLRLVQLLGVGHLTPYDQQDSDKVLTYESMMTDGGLAEIATYADAIGPWKSLIIPQDREGNLLPATDLIFRAHRAGLLVHAYTFRNEPRYLVKAYNGDPAAEYRRFFALGLDGVFTDFPATALAVLAE
ncbi:MAG: glycerophosphodiester phosphodiesterase [Rhodospirillaceae bacterium]